MRNFTIAAAALAASLTIATQGLAQQSSFVAEANYAEIEERSGVEAGLGYRFASNGFSLAPMVGAYVYDGGDTGQYRYDRSVDRCRNYLNGQFADDADCDDTQVDAYKGLEATYRYNSVELGLGYFLTDGLSAPYATMAVQASSAMAKK